ncbi:MAG TPA: hypothetical protein VMU67_16080 [Steroidobacteraceae bacterium]|nr:hypothetical protein [Steroidobacteraceae bacterium]
MAALEVIAELIPHQGAMCLLERVLEWDADHILLATRSHRAPRNPLRAGGRLRALHLCEYGAQAMAVHGSLLARTAGARARPGLLVSVREVVLNREWLEDLAGELRIEARCLLGSERSSQYAFTVHHGDELIAAGRAAIIVARVYSSRA